MGAFYERDLTTDARYLSLNEWLGEMMYYNGGRFVNREQE